MIAWSSPLLYALMMGLFLLPRWGMSATAVLDLSQWDGQAQISLKGPWEFYWNRLLVPGEDLPKPDALLESGRNWNDKQLDDGRLPGAFGQATYRLVLKGLPQRTSGYEIQITHASSQYRVAIFAENQSTPLAEAKSGDVSSKESRTVRRTHVLPLPADGRQNYEVLIWVTNYHVNIGGLWATPILAPYGQTVKLLQIEGLANLVACGVALATGVYSFMIWWRRRDDWPAFYLALVALMCLWRIICITPWVRNFLPDHMHNITLKLEYASIPGGFMAYLLFLQTLFPSASKTLILRTIYAVGTTLFLIPFLFSALFMTTILPIYQLFAAASAAAYVWLLVRAFQMKKDGVALVAVGCSLIIFAVSYDIAVTTIYSFDAVYLTPLAVTAFLMFQAQQVAKRSSDAYIRAERYATELVENEKARTMFFHNTSHELRTPLNGLIGFLQLLNQGSYGDLQVTAREQVQKCLRLANSLKNQVNTILDLAKSKKGTLRLMNSRLDLSSILAEVEALGSGLQLNKANSSFNLQHSWTPDLAEFVSDHDKLLAVLRNLIGNAFKFCDSKRMNEVGLEIMREPGILQIVVSDTGIGIPESQKEKIFDEFQQVSGDARRAYEGTGLGLTMVRDIVNLMGGTITLESKLGSGSRFTIRLPEQKDIHLMTGKEPVAMEEPREQSPMQVAAPRLPSSGGKARILVVDDHEMNCELLQDILSEEGYSVLIALGGEDGLRLLREELPDLLLLDMMMPYVSGEDVIKAIQQDSSLSDIPVILITARASDDDRLYGLSLGADDYLAKPIHHEELLFRVKNILHRKALIAKVAAAEEHEKLAQLGQLMRELSHELKNVFQLNYRTPEEDQISCEYLLQKLPVASPYWNQAAQLISRDQLLSGEINLSALAFQNQLQSQSQALRYIRLVLAQTDLLPAQRESLWAVVLQLAPESLTECEHTLRIVRKFLALLDRTRYANELIVNVLEYSRNESNSDVASLLETLPRILNLIQPRLQRSGIRLDTDIIDCQLQINPVQLMQVALNLLTNACDALDGVDADERWITIRCFAQNQKALLSFSNGGPPLSAEKAKAIFQESWSTKGKKGYGLGLAISQRIIQRNHGQIMADSAAAQPTFVIRLNILSSQASYDAPRDQAVKAI